MWKNFYEKLGNFHRFQSVEWQLLAIKKYRLTFLNKLSNKVVVSIFYKKNDEVYAIFPFVIKNKKAYICGDMAGSDYVDFLYMDNFNAESLAYMLKEIKNKYRLEAIYFRGIQMESKSNCLIKDLDNKKIIKETKCVGIDIDKTYDEFLKGLKKSVRQNLRTAENRLKTDNKDANFEIHHNSKIDSNIVSEVERIYQLRQQNKYTNYKTYLKKVVKYVYNLIHENNYNVVFDSMENNTNHILGIFKIDSKIAAYCYGPVTHGTVSIIHVAINEEFHKYSPGKLLITYLIKYLKSEENTISAINYFDLTIGDESYKYELGGIEKIRSDYIVKL